MAANNEINAQVGINLTPKGMENALSVLNKRLDNTIAKMNKAGAVAAQQIKTLAMTSKNLDAVANFNANRRMGGAESLQALGKRARAYAELGNATNQYGRSVDVLRGRIRDLDTSFGKMARRGVEVTDFHQRAYANLQNNAQAYAKLSRTADDYRTRIQMLSRDGQKAFAPMLDQFERLDKANAKAFATGGFKTDYSTQIASTRQALGAMGDQLRAREKIEAKTRLNIEALREEGRQILTNSRLQREALLADATRKGERSLKNRELIGEASAYRRIADSQQRLANQTNFLITAKRQLNAELAKPVEQQNAARIDQLIARYKLLQREIGETIAMRNREQSAAPKTPEYKGGFFSGIKAAPGNFLTEKGGGAYGAGALVGRVASYAVAAGAIYGLISSIQQGISFAIQFEDALAQLQAVSASTTTEMERLSAGIFEVSKNSADSVMELTKSATIIAQAGFAGEELKMMLQSVVNLSAASGSTPAESVDILTSALGAFQMSASEASRVTDILVTTLNESKLGVSQVQQSLQYLGNTAAANNVTIEELVATTASLADAGVRGSTAATGLRQMLVDLMNPSQKLIDQLQRIGLSTSDIDVKVLGLNEVLRRLRSAGFEAYGAMETRAAAAYVAASRNIENTERLLVLSEKEGAAQEAAAVRVDSLEARWQRLWNTMAEFGAGIGENLIPVLKLLLVLLEGIVVSIGAIAELITRPLKAFGLLTQEANYSSVSLKEAAASFEAAGYSAEEAAVRAAQMGDSLGDVTTALKDTSAQMASLEMDQLSLRDETQKLIMREEELAGANGNLNETTTGVSSAVSQLSSRFPGLRDEFSKTQGGIAGLIQSLVNLDRKAQETLRNLAQTALAQADMERKNALQELGGVSGKFSRDSRVSFTPRTRRENPQLVRDTERLQTLMRSNTTSSLQQAHSLLLMNPALQQRYPTTYASLTTALDSYTRARQDTDLYTERLGTAEFALTDQGQELIRSMQEDTGRSTRAASQGNSGGMNRAQLEAQFTQRERRYDEIESEVADNPYAATLLEQARASTRAARNRMAPPVDKEAAKDAERAASKAEREARRREEELERIDARIAKEELEYRQELYNNTLDTFKNAPKLDDLPDVLDDLDDQLDSWLTGEAELSMQQIEALNPSREQRAKMMATAGRKIEQMRVEEVKRMADTLAAVLKNFIDTSVEAIDDDFKQAMRPTEQALAIAQARVQGLNNPLGNENTPEYMKTVVQNRSDIAERNNQFASVAANEERIRQLTELAAEVAEQKRRIEQDLSRMEEFVAQEGVKEGEAIVVRGQLEESRITLRGIEEELGNIDTRTEDLIDANAALMASYGVLREVPMTFGGGMRMALEAMKLEIGAADGLGQELIKNLDQPLRALHSSFKGFFSDVVSGTVTLGGAFKNMAATIIDAMLEMVAVALANQFFSILAGAIGGPNMSGLSSKFGSATDSLASWGLWRGGEVPAPKQPKGYYGGGSISSGLPTRDSTLINAAQGEYVIRRPAAQSIGKGFLDAINARGAHALKDAGPQMNIMQASAAPPVNVYVVAPEEKPTMGPNDVLATFSNDVLKGGVTKKLIQQVARNG